MTRTAMLLIALFTVLSAGCASSPSTTGTEAAHDSDKLAVTGADDEVICRRMVQTGSHFSRRVCMTRKEFAELSQQTQDVIDEANRGVTSPQGSN